MKARLIAGFACLALAVSGCASVSARVSPADQGEALTAAVGTMDAVSKTLDAMAVNGQIKGTAAAAARTDLHAAQAALQAAEDAHTLGDASTVTAQLGAMGNLLATVATLEKPPT